MWPTLSHHCRVIGEKRVHIELVYILVKLNNVSFIWHVTCFTWPSYSWRYHFQTVHPFVDYPVFFSLFHGTLVMSGCKKSPSRKVSTFLLSQESFKIENEAKCRKLSIFFNLSKVNNKSLQKYNCVYREKAISAQVGQKVLLAFFSYLILTFANRKKRKRTIESYILYLRKLTRRLCTEKKKLLKSIWMKENLHHIYSFIA